MKKIIEKLKDRYNDFETIRNGWQKYLLFRLGLVTDEKILCQIDHRKEKCSDCPLRKGNWCSRRKRAQLKIHKAAGLFSHKIQTKTVKGCGCYLKAKFFVPLEDTKCPLNRWKI